MTTTRTFVSLIIFLSVFAPFSVSAATSQTATVAQLQAEIQALTAQVKILQALLAARLSAESMSTPAVTSSAQTGATLVVSPVALLSGGMAHAGTAVPVSYLQITNTGKETATLKGFQVTQTGSAPAQSVIGFTTVDDKGGSRGSVGGAEGSTPFVDDTAIAPTDATFAPGQMKLFTIKAVLSTNVYASIGKQLVIDVTGLVSDAAAKGVFPIHGTTWTVAY